jgi:hypothetical protein
MSNREAAVCRMLAANRVVEVLAGEIDYSAAALHHWEKVAASPASSVMRALTVVHRGAIRLRRAPDLDRRSMASS